MASDDSPSLYCHNILPAKTLLGPTIKYCFKTLITTACSFGGSYLLVRAIAFGEASVPPMAGRSEVLRQQSGNEVGRRRIRRRYTVIIFCRRRLFLGPPLNIVLRHLLLLLAVLGQFYFFLVRASRQRREGQKFSASNQAMKSGGGGHRRPKLAIHSAAYGVGRFAVAILT